MIIVCFILFLAAVIACLITGRSLIWALLWGMLLFFMAGLKKGFSARQLLRMIWSNSNTVRLIAPIFMLIGAITALWRASGTISFFLYYGLQGISPGLFVLMAFVLSAVLSMITGTSFGVAGTVGVVLITLARSGGVDLGLTAGAVISGAYFGDRNSPMSSCATLVAAGTATNLYENVREMLKTVALPALLATLIYAVLSVRNPILSVDASVFSALSDNFSLHWLTLLPALLMMVLPLLKVPVKQAMLASVVISFALTVLLQGLPFGEALRVIFLGYRPTQPELQHILSGGGVFSMVKSACLVCLTSLYAGLLEGIDALAFVHTRVERLADKWGLFPATAIVSFLIAVTFCNQSVAVLMTAHLLADSYEKHGASRLEQAIDISNSAVLLPAMIPWCIAITVPLSMMEVGTEAMPWCVLLYLIPLCYFFTKRFFFPVKRRDSAERI